MQKWFPNSWTEFFLYGEEENNVSYFAILTSFLMASRINVFSSFRLSFILARLFFSMMGLEAWKKGPRTFSAVITVKSKDVRIVRYASQLTFRDSFDFTSSFIFAQNFEEHARSWTGYQLNWSKPFPSSKMQYIPLFLLLFMIIRAL